MIYRGERGLLFKKGHDCATEIGERRVVRRREFPPFDDMGNCKEEEEEEEEEEETFSLNPERTKV